MKIYFSSKFENKLMVQSVVEDISRFVDFSVVSSWIYLDKPLSIEECSVIDFGDIDNCDVLVALFPFSTGANAEVGYAMGRNKKVIYVVEKMFYNGEYKSKFMAKPLFAGVMFHPYNSEEEFNLTDEMVNVYNSFVVHSLDDLVLTLEKLGE